MQLGPPPPQEQTGLLQQYDLLIEERSNREAISSDEASLSIASLLSHARFVQVCP